MTEEIKKILDYLKNDNYETEAPTDIEVSNYDLFKVINSVDNDKLLNYITNLQKKNKDLKESNHNWQRKLSDYKSRNEKAVEYIKKHSFISKDTGTRIVTMNVKEDEVLLNILQGGDE